MFWATASAMFSITCDVNNSQGLLNMLMVAKKLISLFLLVSFINVSWADSSKYLSDLLRDLSPQRAQELEAVQKNFLRYMLYATGKDDDQKYEIFKRARTYAKWELEKIIYNTRLENSALGPSAETRNVINPPRWTLAEEIRYIENSIPSDYRFDEESVRVLNTLFDNLDERLLNQQFFQINFGGNNLLPDGDIDAQRFLRELVLSQDDRERALLAVNAFEQYFEKNIQRIRSLGNELSGAQRIRFGGPDLERFITQFLNHYYQNLDSDVIRNMLSDFVELGRTPTDSEVMSIVFKNSGPGIGKLFQQLAREPGMDRGLSELLEVLESDNKAVPAHLMREVLEAKNLSYSLSHIEDRPLGTGTMAQVNAAVLELPTGEHEKVAVRFLKPGIREFAEYDIKVLRSFLNLPEISSSYEASFISNLRRIVDSLENFLYSELDIEETVQKQKLAREFYRQTRTVKVEGRTFKVDIDVPRVYQAGGQTEAVHIQEFIEPGVKFSDLNSKLEQKAVARAIVYTWFDEALMGTGFIHADLHQGNFTILPTEKEGHFRVVLFDLGMSEFIDDKLKRAFLLIGSGSNYDSPKLIARGFSVLNDEFDEAALFKRVKSEFAINRHSTENWILWGMRHGLIHSEKLGTLARGASLIRQLPYLISETEMEKTLTLVERMVAKRLIGNTVTRSNMSVLTPRDLLHIGGAFSKKSCTTLVNKIFESSP